MPDFFGVYPAPCFYNISDYSPDLLPLLQVSTKAQWYIITVQIFFETCRGSISINLMCGGIGVCQSILSFVHRFFTLRRFLVWIWINFSIYISDPGLLKIEQCIVKRNRGYIRLITFHELNIALPAAFVHSRSKFWEGY